MAARTRSSHLPLALLGLLLSLTACGDPAEFPDEPSRAEPSNAEATGQSRQGLTGDGTFERVQNFGDNPGGLNMFRYTPSPAPQGPAPLLVAMHPCGFGIGGSAAADYRNAGWEVLADRFGFYVVYPEQTSSNNGLYCFNWGGENGARINMDRDDGEALSLLNMVRHTEGAFDIDDRRIFATGFSGGAAMTNLLLAVYPDVFAGGASLAGIPYECYQPVPPPGAPDRGFSSAVSNCLSRFSPVNRSPQEWGDSVRAQNPNYNGPWPRVSIWHGTIDGTVRIQNSDDILSQWTNVHGIDATPDATEMVDGHERRVYNAPNGEPVVEYYRIQGGGHVQFVDPSEMCGTASGAFFGDSGICPPLRIVEFFGLDQMGGMGGDRTPPTVSFTAPAEGMTVMGMVNLTVSADDNEGVVEVEYTVNGRSIGTADGAPFGFTWDASGEANGAYRIVATARDAAGNTGMAEVNVTVAGGVDDMTPPTVTVTAPAEGAMISGVVALTAEASDDNGVARVAFFIDDAPVGEAMAEPYTVSWNAGAVPPGAHTVVARAFDAAGNEAVSDPVNITTIAGDGPQVSISAPAEGAMVSGIIDITVDATANAAIAQVVLFDATDSAMEVQIGTDRAAPYEFLWDLRSATPGPRILVARAFDVDGGIGETRVSITVTADGGMGGGEGMGGMGGMPEEETGRRKVGKEWWGCAAAPTRDNTTLWWLALLALPLMRRRSSRRRLN